MWTTHIRFIFIFSIFVCRCTSFFAHAPYDSDVGDSTHEFITSVAFLTAIEQYVIETKNATTLYDFFGTDTVSRNQNDFIRGRLAELVANTQNRKKDKDFMHCSNEQIEEAHKSIIYCRKSLKIYAKKDELDALLRRLGECLYTLQSFYSNTNWVEMFGDRMYEEFGMPGNHTLMDIVDSLQMPCADTTYSNESCPNNIIISKKLTSGYHAGRGTTRKPARPLGSSAGKCSHGGVYDPSRETVAKCGINKDSGYEKYSPHNHLHAKASEAAIQATISFLSAKEYGLIDFLGTRTIDKLFHTRMRTEKSLGFAIDYTGSMTNDINQVKDGVLQLLSSVDESGMLPKHYVLSLFNDPAQYNYVYKFQNLTDMNAKVQGITTYSNNNPDCPELAVAGMINAVNLSLPHSPVFVFTDAAAKDEYRRVRLVQMVKEKDIKLNLFVKDECKKRRHGAREKRSISFYEELAKETGGSVYSTTTHQISSVLLELMNNYFPSSEVLLFEHHWTFSEDNHLEIPVDSTINVLKIRIIGSSSISDVNYYAPNGIIEDFTKKTSNRYRTTSGETIISIKKPNSGMVKLNRVTNIDLSVNVTAQSSISLSVDILKEESNGNIIRVFGNPIADTRYFIQVKLKGLAENGTIDHIAFHFADGSPDKQKECLTPAKFAGNELKCTVSMSFTESDVVIEAVGNDTKGLRFKRQYWKQFQPTTVELLAVSVEDEAILNAKTKIRYKLVNHGKQNVTYVTTIKSTRPDFLLRPTAAEYLVPAGVSKIAAFHILATVPSVVFSYTIEVRRKNGNSVLQSLTEDILVTDVERPVCTLKKVIGWCDESVLNTRNCSLKSWRVDAEIKFDGVELKTISLKGASVFLTHDNFTDVVHGPIMANATGDCCSPAFQMTVVDNDDFLVQCVKLISNDGIVKSMESFPLEESGGISSSTIIAISCSIGVLIVVLIFAYSLVSLQFEKRKIEKRLLKAPPQREMVSSRPTFHKFSLKKEKM